MRQAIKYLLAVLLIGVAIAGTIMTAEMTEEARKGYTGPVEEIKDNVVLKTALPKVPAEVFALKIEDKDINTKDAKKVAENILGSDIVTKDSESKQSDDDKKTSIVDQNDKDKEITVYKHGQLKYLSGKEWDGKYRKNEMLDEKQAKDKAIGYINKLTSEGTFAKNMVEHSMLEVVYDETYEYDSRNGNTESYVSNQHVNLQTSYNGIHLNGAGAKVRVYLGKGGKVTGVLNFVGNLKSDKKVSVITPQEAIEKLKTEGYKDVEIESMELIYNVPSLEENADFVYPAYDIKGKMYMKGDSINFATIIPATK